MNPRHVSGTARVIAVSTMLLAAEDGSAVPPESAELCRRFLYATAPGRVLAALADCSGGRRLLRAVEMATHPGIVAHYARRKRRIENLGRAAIAEGFSRVIVYGAGFDTMACRLAGEFPEITFIEVDLPGTQAVKRRALGDGFAAGHGNLQFLTVNPGGPLWPVPEADSRPATLVILEGVLMYLDPGDIDCLFAALQGVRAGRLRIIFTFMTARRDGVVGFHPSSRAVQLWLRASGEPFSWALSPDEAGSFLERRGFSLTASFSTQDLSREEGALSVLDGENLAVCERSYDAHMVTTYV